MRDDNETSWVSARDVCHIIFRHKWKALIFFALVVVSATAWTFLIAEKVYQSEARLLVRLGRENLAMDPSVSGPVVNMMRDRESEINSEIAIFTNRQLTEEVVSAFGEAAFLAPGEKKTGWRMYLSQAAKSLSDGAKYALQAAGLLEPMTPFEEAVTLVADNLQVETERRANILSVTYNAPTPELAHDALDRLLKGYLDRHIKAHAGQASPQFFEEQAELLRTDLTNKERALQEYQSKNEISQIDQQKQVMLQQISDTEKQLADATAQASGSDARIAVLQKSLNGYSRTLEISRTTGRTNNAADTLKAKLADLKIKESDLSSRYPDTHQPLVDLRDQVTEIEKALQEEEATHTEVTTGIDQNFQELELNLQMERAQLQASIARKQAIESELASLREKVGTLAAQQFEYNDMKRDAELAEQEYRQYRDNVQRSKIFAALDQDKVSNISVVQAATTPIEPVSPRKGLNLGLALALGLIGGLGLTFLAEYLDETVKSRADVERRLNVPVLVEISEKEMKACI